MRGQNKEYIFNTDAYKAYFFKALRMIDVAFEIAGLEEEVFSRVMMVGNNLKRDILGANQLNIISVHTRWSPRYEKEPVTTDEQPDYVIDELMELLPLVRKINEKLVLK